MSPLAAEAHLNSTGMGPIYDGLMHFLMSPEDLVPVLALALLSGLRGATYGRRTLFVLPGRMVAWRLDRTRGLSIERKRDRCRRYGSCYSADCSRLTQSCRCE